MKDLRIAQGLALPADAVTQTFGILAKRGMGKTYTAAVLVEELLKAGSRVVVADPIGVWYGLRAAANGKDPGLPIVVMGGDHADLPLPVDAGKAVADFIVDSEQSVILDLSLFRKGEQTRFMTDFAETLYHRNRLPLHLVLDEADAFAPQRPQKGEERMLGAVEDLVRRGRARGIGVTLVTQRAAVINKNVLTQVEVLVALRTIAPQDREAMDGWIRAHGTQEERAEFMESLASLGIGEAWFWSPGWLGIFQRVQVRRRETFDSSSTPKAGETKRAPKKLADVDLAALKATFATSIEKAKAKDPALLQARVRELERELAAARKVKPEVERVEVPVLSDDDKSILRELVQLCGRVDERILGVLEDGASRARRLVHAQPRSNQPTPVAARASLPVSSPQVRGQNAHPHKNPISTGLKSGGNSNGSLGTPARKILTALARYPQGKSRKQLGPLTGYRSDAGHFGNVLADIRGPGYVEGESSCLRITDAGLAALGDFEPLPEPGDELIEWWLAKVGAPEAKVLRILVDAYPRGLTRAQLGDATGYRADAGHFGNVLSALRGLDLIEGKGELRASPELFS